MKDNDPVNHPSHYTDGQIEVIDFINDKKLNFNRGNAIKYTARAGKKDPNKEIEDLKKAVFYLQDEIKRLEVAKEESRGPEKKAPSPRDFTVGIATPAVSSNIYGPGSGWNPVTLNPIQVDGDTQKTLNIVNAARCLNHKNYRKNLECSCWKQLNAPEGCDPQKVVTEKSAQ